MKTEKNLTSNCKFFGTDRTVSQYLNDIRKYKVLTPAEEDELFQKYQETVDQKARNSIRERIVNSNQRFIFSLAKGYAKNEGEVLDYVQEGNKGLLLALNEFDTTKGFKFITFAVWYIRREMNYYLNVKNPIVRRTNTMKIGKKADKIRQKYFAETGFKATDELIAHLLDEIYGIKVKDFGDFSEMHTESIHVKVKDDKTYEDDTVFTEATSIENNFEEEVEREHQNALLLLMLSTLPEKESKLIKMLFGIGYDYPIPIEEICLEFDLDEQMLAEAKRKILQKVRKKMQYA